MDAEQVVTSFYSTGFSMQGREKGTDVCESVGWREAQGSEREPTLSSGVNIWFTCSVETSSQGLFRG